MNNLMHVRCVSAATVTAAVDVAINALIMLESV